MEGIFFTFPFSKIKPTLEGKKTQKKNQPTVSFLAAYVKRSFLQNVI